MGSSAAALGGHAAAHRTTARRAGPRQRERSNHTEKPRGTPWPNEGKRKTGGSKTGNMAGQARPGGPLDGAQTERPLEHTQNGASGTSPIHCLVLPVSSSATSGCPSHPTTDTLAPPLHRLQLPAFSSSLLICSPASNFTLHTRRLSLQSPASLRSQGPDSTTATNDHLRHTYIHPTTHT